MKNNLFTGIIPPFGNWKVKTAKKAEEITKVSGFQRVRAVVQTAENPEGNTVFGWIADYNSGHMFIPYDSEEPLNYLAHWFEQIEPIAN